RVRGGEHRDVGGGEGEGHSEKEAEADLDAVPDTGGQAEGPDDDKGEKDRDDRYRPELPLQVGVRPLDDRPPDADHLLVPLRSSPHPEDEPDRRQHTEYGDRGRE